MSGCRYGMSIALFRVAAIAPKLHRTPRKDKTGMLETKTGGPYLKGLRKNSQCAWKKH